MAGCEKWDCALWLCSAYVERSTSRQLVRPSAEQCFGGQRRRPGHRPASSRTTTGDLRLQGTSLPRHVFTSFTIVVVADDVINLYSLFFFFEVGRKALIHGRSLRVWFIQFMSTMCEVYEGARCDVMWWIYVVSQRGGKVSMTTVYLDVNIANAAGR